MRGNLAGQLCIRFEKFLPCTPLHYALWCKLWYIHVHVRAKKTRSGSSCLGGLLVLCVELARCFLCMEYRAGCIVVRLGGH
jgi:hypothetical protein